MKQEYRRRKISSSVIESIVDSYIKELNEQLEYGILKYDSTDTYRFTLYGALRELKMICTHLQRQK